MTCININKINKEFRDKSTKIEYYIKKKKDFYLFWGKHTNYKNIIKINPSPCFPIFFKLSLTLVSQNDIKTNLEEIFIK